MSAAWPESRDLPVTYPGMAGQTLKTGSVTLLNSTSYTAWTQIEASAAADYYITALMIGSDLTAAASDGPYTVDIGVGAAASEAVVGQGFFSGEFGLSGTQCRLHGVAPVSPWVTVLAGSRLSFRVAKTSTPGAGTPTFYLAVACVPVVNVEGN